MPFLALLLVIRQISSTSQNVELQVPIPIAQTFPPTEVSAVDVPNDKGGSISIQWKPVPDETSLSNYEVLKSEDGIEYKVIATLPPGANRFEDTGTKDGKQYWYKIRAVWPENSVDSDVVGPVVSSAQWFHHGRWNALILSIVFSALILLYIRYARRGASLYLRPIPGLDAVDEAVGRSTEMGKPILFSLGLGYVSDIATIAGLSILGRVAKKAAEYQTRVIVPCFDPVVMTAAQDTIKQGFYEAGRPDLFNERDIFFLTSDQFGYAAGVDGIMIRENPGAVFFQGYFYAESLILAETGYSIGAIQIAGTSAITQLPFFFAACDYTLIGEELFVASTYLTREPVMLGSIKGQDYSKLIIIILIILGIIFSSLGKFLGFINFFTSA